MIRLHHRAIVRARISLCFDLARSVDVHIATAESIGAKAIGGRQHGLSEPGDSTSWSAVFFGCRFGITTGITQLVWPWEFRDEMTHGPFKYFGHHYTFRAVSESITECHDDFFFESAFPFVDRFVLKTVLQKALYSRARKLAEYAEAEEMRCHIATLDDGNHK